MQKRPRASAGPVDVFQPGLPLKVEKSQLASGTGPTRTVVACTVAVTQARRLIRSAEQHQEECPISLVFGSGSSAFRTAHNDLPFGRAHAPPPYTAALFQERFKNRKLIRHCDHSLVSLVLCRLIWSQVQGLQRCLAKLHEISDDSILVRCPEASAQRRMYSCDAERLPRKTI